VSQRLKVRAENEICEYELGEMAYEVLPLQALTVFSDFEPGIDAPPMDSSPRVTASLPAFPSPTVLPTAAALMEAETAALYALHQAQADLGEQIEVRREADRLVVVEGLVETDARKRQLIEALRRVPLVAARIQSVEEVVRQAAQNATPQSAPDAHPAEVISTGEPAHSGAQGRSVFEQRLVNYFTARGENRKNAELKITELSNGVVTDRAAILAETWALRRLAERFSAEREREITPASRQRIEEMINHHVARLRERTRTLRGHLEPVLVAIAANTGGRSAPSQPVERDWQAQALMVFKSVERVYQLAGLLFTTAGGPAETPEQSARQMLEAVARMEGAIEALAHQTTR
jgi:hypothetical protein